MVGRLARRVRFAAPAVVCRTAAGGVALAVLLAACGGGGGGGGGGAKLVPKPNPAPGSDAPRTSAGPPVGATAPGGLGFPDLATKNTTRVDSSDPVAVAAAVALAVFPSAAPGTHPTAVALAPTDDWQAAIAAASLMGQPFRVPLLLSGPGTLPRATAQALALLAPTGAGALGGAQLIRIGDVPRPAGLKTTSISGSDPYALAARLDAYEAREHGRRAFNVMVASAQSPQYAMPAAGYAAESGEPILFVNATGVPAATRAALRAHHRPHIFVIGPSSVIPDAVLHELAAYGTVKRIGAAGAAANAVAFTEYRDPPCAYGQACVHLPRSFGWAITSPGHGYVLLDSRQPLDAAAASALSSAGSYGPQLLIDDPNSLPQAVLDYLLNYATPGYTAEGPTAAVYNHAWLIGTTSEISIAVQAQIDSLLEAVPQR